MLIYRYFRVKKSLFQYCFKTKFAKNILIKKSFSTCIFLKILSSLILKELNFLGLKC